ncbi:MAG: hypothetical protein ACRELD_06355 [Longimicrobiales bacterium]
MRLASEQIGAVAEGTNELREGLPVLTRIHMRYRLQIPRGSREIVDRALGRHVLKCPTAQSLRGAVDVTWDAEVVER